MSLSQQQQQQQQQTLYFAYGSNLSLTQMSLRCPHSTYKSLALLRHWRWIINARGYANIVPSHSSSSTTSNSFPSASASASASTSTSASAAKHDNDNDEEEGIADDDVVYGLLYALTPTDEAQLDINEGVPFAYQKFLLDVEVLGSGVDGNDDDDGQTTQEEVAAQRPQAELTGQVKKVKALIYIDDKRIVEGVPRSEYVGRMNRGIEDAVRRGMPVGYVRGVLRRFIPEDGGRGGLRVVNGSDYW